MVLAERGQGTIEYLVIIAVVVVISLIVVGLFVNMTGSPSQEIIDSSNKLGTSSSGGISVVEAVIDSAGDSLIRLNNNSSDAITLTKISVGGVDNSFSEQVVGMDSKVFSLSELSSGCACASGQKSVKCEYVITYVQNGITKTDRLTKTIDCVTTTASVNPDSVVGLGNGTLTDPWIINNCQELQNITEHLDGNYALGADINCADTRSWNSGQGFIPVGFNTGSFSGTLNGVGRKITNLYSAYDDMTGGLFGELSTTALISNMDIIDANILAYACAGIVASNHQGTIRDMNLTGTIYTWCEYFSGAVAPTADGCLYGGVYGDVINVNTAGVSRSYSVVSCSVDMP